MSLLSVNQLLVMMSAENLALVHRTHGFSARILGQQHQHFPQDNSAELAVWQPALTQLDAALAAMKVPPKTQLNIILASDFVRYLSLPAQQVNMSQEEKHAYALAAYHEVYGSAVDAWEVKLNQAAPRQASMAAAIDKALLAALAQLAEKHQLKLSSTQPYLMSAFNALSKQIKNTSGYLAIVELKRSLLVNLQFGKCQSVRLFSAGADWQSELKNLLARELLLTEVSNPVLFVYAPTQKNITLDAINGWQIAHLSPKNGVLTNPQMAMLEAAL